MLNDRSGGMMADVRLWDFYRLMAVKGTEVRVSKSSSNIWKSCYRVHSRVVK
jgi:hypothetical protein